MDWSIPWHVQSDTSKSISRRRNIFLSSLTVPLRLTGLLAWFRDWITWGYLQPESQKMCRHRVAQLSSGTFELYSITIPYHVQNCGGINFHQFSWSPLGQQPRKATQCGIRVYWWPEDVGNAIGTTQSPQRMLPHAFGTAALRRLVDLDGSGYTQTMYWSISMIICLRYLPVRESA